jgi:hypothetical protein
MPKRGFFAKADVIKTRCYQIEYNGAVRVIICQEYIFKNGDNVIMLPSFLIRGRRYPLQAYERAIILYSENPLMSQRAVAKQVSEEFGLSKFSHSIVCRIFKGIEVLNKVSVDTESGSEDKYCDQDEKTEDMAEAGNISDIGEQTTPQEKCRFHSVEDTAYSRAVMAAFLNKSRKDIEGGVLSIVDERPMKRWYDSLVRLLTNRRC